MHPWTWWTACDRGCLAVDCPPRAARLLPCGTWEEGAIWMFAPPFGFILQPCTGRSGRFLTLLTLPPRLRLILGWAIVSSNVTWDAILNSQIQQGACELCEVNGGQWGKGGSAYRPDGQRGRRARARASLGIGTDPVVLAVASRPDWTRCHTPRSEVTTIRRWKNLLPYRTNY